MNIFRLLRNYICYCGIEKDEYKAVKKADLALYDIKSKRTDKRKIYE